jgi:NagD protein
MDGVLVHEGTRLPGPPSSCNAWSSRAAVPRPHQQLDLHPARPVGAAGASGLSCPRRDLDVGAGHGATSSAPVARRLGVRHRRGGLTTALHEVGYTLTDVDRTSSCSARPAPTRSRRSPRRSGSSRRRAVHRHQPDVTGPSREGPAARHRVGRRADHQGDRREPYFVGKPNPMMFRSALNRIEAHSENTCMVGDRMDTDVVAGIEAGLETIWC